MKLLNKLFLSLVTLTACISFNTSVNANADNQAVDVPLSFYHQDWQLVCDNTRTCRAVGYQKSDSYDYPVALMLKRNAGANQRVRAYVKFGEQMYEEQITDEQQINCPNRTDIVHLSVNGQDYGVLDVDRQQDEINFGEAWELTTKQTHALINTLPTSSNIEFTVGCKKYVVSDKGSTAVLLKMDDVQGRIGTRGAIVKRGNQSESTVLPALPTPIITTQKIVDNPKDTGKDSALFEELQTSMDSVVLPTLDGAYCEILTDADVKTDRQWSFYRLNDHQLLAEHICWTAAYNFGYGYWIIEDTAPYTPRLITTSGSGYNDGMISASHKGRGIGDCWYVQSWQWAQTEDGDDFIMTDDYETGMCRGIAAGGSFLLPSLVTEVVNE